MTNSETYPIRPSKAERYQIEREKDEKFSLIPEDLIVEYSDLHNKAKCLELDLEEKMKVLNAEYKQKKKINHLNLENNQKKMETLSGLSTMDLANRLPKDHGPIF